MTVEINVEVCKTIAVQHGLPLQFVIKEFHVFDVLGQVTAANAANKGFVFKGGTALNKVYLGKTQRFSEDLDFDLGTESIAEVRSFAEGLSKKLEGYGIGEFRRVKDTIQFSASYDNLLGNKDFVRIDVAAKRILTAKPLAMLPASSGFSSQTVAGFLVYSLEDLTARKMHALRTRAEGKDFFDVHTALPLCGAMRKPIEKMLESEKSGETTGEFMAKTIERVKKADTSKLKNLTNPFIPTPLRPKDWAALRDDLIILLESLA
ncbi:MAG: nucleotidyl transferase AbiEii/AbiGii toxin family protein [Candidatus Micrarchaeia archaeon]|jgi:predicted nucleotidyltransferase component of viral defense system